MTLVGDPVVTLVTLNIQLGVFTSASDGRFWPHRFSNFGSWSASLAVSFWNPAKVGFTLNSMCFRPLLVLFSCFHEAFVADMPGGQLEPSSNPTIQGKAIPRPMLFVYLLWLLSILLFPPYFADNLPVEQLKYPNIPRKKANAFAHSGQRVRTRFSLGEPRLPHVLKISRQKSKQSSKGRQG